MDVANTDRKWRTYFEATCDCVNYSFHFSLPDAEFVVSTKGTAWSSTNSIQSDDRGFGKRCRVPDAESQVYQHEFQYGLRFGVCEEWISINHFD